MLDLRQATAPADPAPKTNPRSQAGDRLRSVQEAIARPSTSSSAPTPPKTNLNLPQEKHGTAPPRLRLRLRLRTRRRHPVPRPLCDRLLTTHRPATLAPSHRPGRPSPEDPAWSPALQRLGKIAGRRRPRSGADTLFEPIRPTT
jgi:hypothetical protein